MVIHADMEDAVAHVLCCVSPVDKITCHCADGGLAFYDFMYNMFVTLKLLHFLVLVSKWKVIYQISCVIINQSYPVARRITLGGFSKSSQAPLGEGNITAYLTSKVQL